MTPIPAALPYNTTRYLQRRSFFNLFQKPPREVKEPDIDPGYATLLEFRSLENEGARLPPRKDLLKAFRSFFRHKLKDHRPLNSTQAFVAHRLLLHLVENPKEDVGLNLTLQDLRVVRDALLYPPKASSSDHLDLTKTTYSEITRLEVSHQGADQGASLIAGEAGFADFKRYITALTLYGGSVDAAAQLTEYWRQPQSIHKGARGLWAVVLQGLAREGLEDELVHQMQNAEQLGVEYMAQFHEIMTTFFAARDRVEETAVWFEKPIHGQRLPTPETYLEIAKFSRRNKLQEWAQPIFQKLCEANPHKGLWDVIFQWSVLLMNKGAEDIKHMIETTIQLTSEAEPFRPDTATLNGLVRAAIEKKDSYLAERFITLGKDMGMVPDSITYILQMDYRIDAKDLGGARVAYENLENSFIEDDEDLPVVNKYMRALCTAERPDNSQILDVTSAIEQRNATLEPDTVVALCMHFLKADQQLDIIDTLSVNAVQYSLEERDKVLKAFVNYCLDSKNSTSRVWDAYSLLRQFFPETDTADRVQLMDAFFARHRADMACLVFGHMRGHENPSLRPGSAEYVRCLEGLGRCRDDESLRMVHNMLKMDTTIQMDTRMYNALMIAYVGCDKPSGAIEFWSGITNSAEGPSYNSLEIVFRVCEMLHNGDRTAREIWDKVQRMELEVPPAVFASYCAAIAGHGNLDEVKKLLLGMDSGVGYPPNLKM
jgi:hypothetical protein